MEKIVEQFKEWVDNNNLLVDWIDDRIFKIGEDSFYLIQEKRRETSTIESIFTDDWHLNISESDIDLVREIGIKNYCFRFGNVFYYTREGTVSKPQLNPLKYIGSAKIELDLPYSFLGVRGKYEVCNGSGHYSDWVKKSKFLGIKTLGICEYHTLAGVLNFQQECKNNGIIPVIGETIKVRDESFTEYQIKCYVLTEEGWFNLLHINKVINVDNVNDPFILESELVKYTNGLVIVFDAETPLSTSRISKYKIKKAKLFYQLDFTEFKGFEKEKLRLTALKYYIDNFLSVLEPILIQDAFYLDKEYSHLKKILNNIGSLQFQFESNNQWFKTLDEIFQQWCPLFEDNDDRLYSLFMKSIENTNWITDKISFEIETGVRHLPKFENSTGEDNEDLFLRLISEGLEKKGLSNNEEYWERVSTEVEVIKMGGVIDYFLILWDIVEWCKSQNILTGVGRGSASGCLIAYLLGITGIDPIKYGLLFERFLNKGRVFTSLPDIDTDFEGERRDEVKRYMEEKYGLNYVCSVGTYGTFKLKSAIRDIGKQFGVQAQELNYMTSTIGDDGRYASGEYLDLFKESSLFKPLKDFIVKRPALIETIQLVLKLPKNTSVHPCATIILPKRDQHGRERDIFSWFPVKKVDGVLVSEWEGGPLEDTGFLKEDILGIKQLDKFRSIFNKVKENRGIDLDMSSVDLYSDKIYELFRRGLSSDVFHFGSKGLTSYAQDVLPYSMEELIAMLSVYRPGPIESNAHTDYVKFKFGLKKPEYDYKLEEVTKETYGLYIYQEQVMKAVQQLGGMDLVTADDVRKAMGKMSMKLIMEYRERFIQGAVKNSCSEVEAEVIWNKLEAFAKYGFNKSHAASYTYTGLMCQWLKVEFPIEFWTTALEHASDNEVSRYVSEVSKLNSGVSIVPPNVNKSYQKFTSDIETGKIYWAINKVKWVGEAATESIVTEREENGEYFDIEEFLNRVNTSKVNKRVVEHLILAGCFDEIYNIDTNVKGRREILSSYYQLTKVKDKDKLELPLQSEYNWWWILKQKEVSGLGYFNYEQIILRSNLQSLISMYVDPIKLESESIIGKRVVVAGIIVDKKIRKTKKGDEFCQLELESSDETIYFLLWFDIWSLHKESILSGETNMFIGSGTVHRDSYKKCNTLQSDRNSKIQIL